MTKEEFKHIYDNYFDPVRNYLFYRSGDTDVATDIAQEVFLKLWEKQLPLDRNKVKGLLFKMAGDMFISRYRRSKVEMDYSKSLQFDYNEQSPEEHYLYEELKMIYEKTLLKLPEKQRVVFLMSRLEKLKYYEIAERLNISVKAVEKRMKYALLFLRKALNY